MSVPTVPSANQFALRSNAAAYNNLLSQLTFNWSDYGIDPLSFGYITFATNGSDNYSKTYKAGSTVLGGIIVTGGGGDDIVGQGAADVILAGDGNDEANGGGGDDHIFGGTGNDDLDGGLGNDRLYGEEGNDELAGGTGNDTMDGGIGSDELDGQSGNDTLNGGAGEDSLDGDEGNDVLNGGGDDDDLNGDTGNDTMDGDSGADKITGGAGDDTMEGGSGADSFYGHDGHDVIEDFDGGAGDKIVLFGATADDVTVTEEGGDTLLTFANGDTIRLEDVGDFDINDDVDFGAFTRYLGTLDSSSYKLDGTMYFGAGNLPTNYHVLVNHAADIELGLKIHYRQGNDILPDSFGPSDTANYTAPDGPQVIDLPHGVSSANAARAAWNFDFSVNTGIEGSTKVLQDFTFRIIITSGDGESDTFTMQDLGPGNTPWFNSGLTGGFNDEDGANAQLSQNSVNMGFGFFSNFGADRMDAGETYLITLEAWDGSTFLGSVTDSLTLS